MFYNCLLGVSFISVVVTSIVATAIIFGCNAVTRASGDHHGFLWLSLFMSRWLLSSFLCFSMFREFSSIPYMAAVVPTEVRFIHGLPKCSNCPSTAPPVPKRFFQEMSNRKGSTWKLEYLGILLLMALFVPLLF